VSVDWEAEMKDERWFCSLPYLDWYYSLAQHEEPEQLRALVLNLGDRWPLAVELYMKRAGHLSGLHFMTPAEHGKHFVPSIGEDEIIRRSTHWPSLFLQDYGSARLQATFWGWLSMYFDAIKTPAEYMMFMDLESTSYESPEAQLWRRFVASDGESSRFLCYDIHIDSKTVHCYPVTEAEAKRILGDAKILIYDGFNC